MRVYILTEEPYHDNSAIIGVFSTEQEGLAALHASINPEEINGEDHSLREWSLHENKCLNQWNLVGEQIWGFDVDSTCTYRKPVRRAYVLHRTIFNAPSRYVEQSR